MRPNEKTFDEWFSYYVQQSEYDGIRCDAALESLDNMRLLARTRDEWQCYHACLEEHGESMSQAMIHATNGICFALCKEATEKPHTVFSLLWSLGSNFSFRPRGHF